MLHDPYLVHLFTRSSTLSLGIYQYLHACSYLFYLLEEWYITVHSILYIACCTSYNTFTNICNTCKMDAFRRLSFHKRNYTGHPFCFIIHTLVTYTWVIPYYMSILMYDIYISYFQICAIFHSKRLCMLYILPTFKHSPYFTLHSTHYISHVYYGFIKYNAAALVRKSYRIFHTEWFPPNRLTQEP